MFYLGEERNLDGNSVTEQFLNTCFGNPDVRATTGPALVYIEPLPNKFHAILAIDDKSNIITNSNSFFSDANFKNNSHAAIREYDRSHSIFARLELTYNYLKTAEPKVTINTPMFMLINTFSATNFGHDLSILFDRIQYYRDIKSTATVVVGEIMKTIPRSLEICQIITKCNQTLADTVYLNRKVFLVKNCSQKNIVTSATVYQCSKIMEVLANEYNYICINPELMNITEIVVYLSNATKIITSHGAISYGNGIFFNSAAKVYNVSELNMPNNLDSNVADFLTRIGE